MLNAELMEIANSFKSPILQPTDYSPDDIKPEDLLSQQD